VEKTTDELDDEDILGKGHPGLIGGVYGICPPPGPPDKT
jgi:hypothetical protein